MHFRMSEKKTAPLKKKQKKKTTTYYFPLLSNKRSHCEQRDLVTPSLRSGILGVKVRHRRPRKRFNLDAQNDQPDLYGVMVRIASHRPAKLGFRF